MLETEHTNQLLCVNKETSSKPVFLSGCAASMRRLLIHCVTQGYLTSRIILEDFVSCESETHHISTFIFLQRLGTTYLDHSLGTRYQWSSADMI
jgi:hypothetical protein